MAIPNSSDQVTKILTIQIDSENAIGTLRQLNDILDEVKDQERQLTKEIKENTETQKFSEEEIERKKKELQALKQAESDYRAQISEVTRVVQKELQADRSKEGSLKQLRAQLSMLTKQYDELSREERESATGDELLKHINELTTEIKDAEYASQRFQRNVGNYPDAVQPVKQQLREITDELMRLRAEGKQNTEEYQAMLEKAGQLKDAMEDTNSEIKQMSSDTSTLNSVLDAGKLAAGGFSAALGVMTLLGGEDSETAKELAEAQKKLQAAIAITTGLQAVQNSLQKESALMMGINKIQTWAAAKAQNAYTAATGKATVAQRIFNAVANANPYVLLATAILTVIGAIAAFTAGSKEQEKQIQSVNSEIRTHLDLINKLKEGYDALNKRTENELAMRIEWAKQTGASIDDVRKAEDDYLEFRRNAIIQRGYDLALDMLNYDTYVERYQYRQQLLVEYEQSRTNAVRAGLLDRAAAIDAEIAQITKLMDADRKRIEAVDQYHQDLNNINLEARRLSNERAKEDQKAAEEAAQRQREAAQRQREAAQRQREEQQRYQDQTLSEMQKAEDALNALIENEFEQRRAIEETAYRRNVEALQKSMEEEKNLHGEDSELYKAYLSQLESLRRQHRQTMGDIAQDQFQNEQELRNNAIKQLEADNDLYWQNRINELKAQGQEAGQVELEALKDTLDNLTQYAGESDAEFYARRLAAQQAYNEKKKALNDAEIAMEKAKAEYMQNIAGSISSLLETVADDNKALLKASKIAALAEVAIKQGVAIAEAVASAAAGDPYTYALRVASAIASTVSAMAEAISSINSVKLARGTSYVKGPGTSTSDSIPAMLSLGEGVVNAKGNALFPGLVQAINDIGNGIAVPVQNQTSYTYTNVANAAGGITPEQIAEAMSQMPPSEVAVSEIDRVGDRINVIENLRNN